jgi:hypothetical protein
MKASKLIKQLQKAIDKYGDIEIGSYDKNYAFDVEKEGDMNAIKFRVLNGGENPLPGVAMDEEDQEQGKSSCESFFGVIFCGQ